jgi:hypothetical protein
MGNVLTGSSSCHSKCEPAMSDAIKKPEPGSPTDHSLEVNFALVVSRMIESVEKDPTLLRSTVYELARIRLLEQFGREDGMEVNRLVNALETAIHGVEAFAQQEKKALPRLSSLHDHKQSAAPQTEIIAPNTRTSLPSRSNEIIAAEASTATLQQVRLQTGAEKSSVAAHPSMHRRSGVFAYIARLIALFCLAAFIGAAVINWPRLQSFVEVARTAGESAASVSQNVEPTSSSPVPDAVKATAHPAPGPPPLLPSTFGIYAVSDGQLQELKPLPGKVPDPRVAVSAAINTPTETTVRSGETKFIVFRRDAATNAPDHAEVRVVARITRAMGVDGAGKVNVSQTQDIWVIRNILFHYKIGPVKDHPEMFQVQPEAADFSLPAGRYALVLKGQGFDFAVAGPITDARQCLERVDAVNGAFYSPCPGK